MKGDQTAVANPPERLTREASRQRTRARLREAAAAVFAERGFYGASVEEIAERAGFSKGAFYSNFETKDDLFLAVLDDRIEADIRALEELGKDSSVPAFLEFLAARAARRAADGDQWTLLSAEFWLHALRHRELVPKLAARQQAGRAALARVIEGLFVQMGLPLPGRAEDLASVMLAVDDGLVLQEALDPTAVPSDLRLRAMLLAVQAAAGGHSGSA
jgi:AcrR family transcriptional regulator